MIKQSQIFKLTLNSAEYPKILNNISKFWKITSKRLNNLKQ